MKRKIVQTIILSFLLLSLSGEADACRFWCAVWEKVPAKVITSQWIDDPQSLKTLGQVYQDGWSVGYYQGASPIIVRSQKASFVDPDFNEAADQVAQADSNIVVGHLRRASSGCTEVPNPHPFVRTMNGKEWIFGHNGGMEKTILTDLIGQQYLEKHGPEVCADNPPDSWIDSELYFIFLLKEIEQAGGHVAEGLSAALNKLYDVIPEEHRYLNFFLSDGESVWVFRKGTSLNYLDDQERGLTIVSSDIPNDNGAWKEFPEDTLAKLEQSRPIQFLLTLDSDRGVALGRYSVRRR